jgi:hypothetical protein
MNVLKTTQCDRLQHEVSRVHRQQQPSATKTLRELPQNLEGQLLQQQQRFVHASKEETPTRSEPANPAVLLGILKSFAWGFFSWVWC